MEVLSFLLIFNVIMGGLCLIMADNRHRNIACGFFMGFIFGIGGLVLIAYIGEK